MIRQPKPRALLSWSGGKDSAYALYECRKAGEVEIVALLTTLTEEYDRTCMHGVRRRLLEQQAEAVGLPLETVVLPADGANEEYERKMGKFLEEARRKGVTSVIFGDIFLEDLRKYREERLAGVGMTGLFPLWGQETGTLARSFLRVGFQAVITCVDSHFLDGSFVGKPYDEAFLARLPEKVDPCGENGEFHSFVHDGPVFRSQIAHRPGEVVLRENRFYFCDLLPDGKGASL